MNYYEKIRNELIDNELTKKAKDYSKNKSDLTHYFNVGRLLVEAQGGEERAKYGNGLIKYYSKKLTNELGKGYTFTALTRMRKFYLLFSKVATMSQQISWSHYVELLALNDVSEINYYIIVIEKNNLGVRQLRDKIKSKEYQRLDNKIKNKLIRHDKETIIDFVKNPIILKDKNSSVRIDEKILKKLILEDLDHFLNELGHGFTYVGNEYKIKIGNDYHYIDILLFNINFNCYVVLELKITPLKKEHIGQIEVYMNYVDKNIRTIGQGITVGIIICKKDNKLLLKYCSDPRIFSTTYQLI